MASGIEQELLEASGFEPRKKLGRQDYLAALARAIHEIDETDFDGMSVEAQDWFNDAVRCLNKKKDLPDFPDAETEAEVAEASSDTDEDDTDDNPADNATDGDDDDDTEAQETAEVDEPEEAPAPVKVAKGKKAKKVEPEEVEAEPEEAKPAKAKKAKKVEAEEPDEEARPQKKGIGDMANRPKDKWGFPINTKNSAAMSLFEKGCRMIDVTEAIGGSYYNALAKVVKRGHTLEKATNGMLKLTCAEATPKKASKAKK